MNEHDTFFDVLQMDVDADHRRIDGADAPPADMWNSIRAQAKPKSKEERTMIASQSISSTPIPAATSTAQERGRIRHTLSLAASFLIVMSVALAGWFATMQLNQPGGSDGQFGLFGQSDQSTTCDVEPMTVDEVMEIVENPYKYASPEEYGMPNSNFTPWDEDFVDVAPMMPESFAYRASEPPTTAAFEQALPVLDKWLACMENGTVGQALRFVDPFSVRDYVTDAFPFYRDEAEVRIFVEELIVSGPYPNQWKNEDTGEILYFNPNLIREEAGTQHMQIGLGFTQFIFIGSEVKDEDGNLLARHDSSLQVSEGKQQERWAQHVLVYSRYTEQWYVVTGSWPYNPRL